MSLHWYACISTNTCCFEMHHISLETNQWALSNTSSIMQICLAVHEILADKAFTATDGLISQSFVAAFVPPTYVQIALIWGFPAQLSLWKSVSWLWRYKLNEVCDTSSPSTVATFLATHLMAVLQPSGYSIFHGRNTPIQLSLPWRSYFCQCLNTETPSISYTICFVYKTSSYTIIC